MRRLAAALAAAVVALVGLAATADAECVIRAELDGIINGPRAEYLERAIDVADRECDALLVVIDTPGGDLASTRRIARAFLDAPVPVIAYVAPPGARAGSAGVFVVTAARIAAMAPGTNIGAAHPVAGSGQDIEKVAGENMAAKAENDAAAFARALAEHRGRNVEWVEAAVRESVSATAAEALERGAIDRVAENAEALLAAVELPVDLEGAEIRPLAMSISERVRAGLGHPRVVYLLLMLGVLGVMIELYNPGLLVPGIVGAASLVLAAIGSGDLPVDVAAVICLGLAALLMVAELFVTSFGLLFAAGVALLLLGSSMWIDTSDPEFFADPSVTLSWGLIIPTIAVVSGAAALLAVQISRAQKRRQATGPGAMIGAAGVAASEIGPESGTARLGGERWNARASGPIAAGEPIEVVGIDGLTLQVRSPTTRRRTDGI